MLSKHTKKLSHIREAIEAVLEATVIGILVITIAILIGFLFFKTFDEFGIRGIILFLATSAFVGFIVLKD